jgi:hypothetical protein
MKTAGKITATLALLLGLYLLGYWLFIKQHWAAKLFGHADPFDKPVVYKSVAYDAVRDIFAPIQELDKIWTVDIPTRKHLTGHWRSEKNSDFVTLGPNQECHFQLGQFAFKGTAKYERFKGGVILEFPHQEQTYLFFLGLNSEPEVFGTSEQAHAQIGTTHVDPSEYRIDYEATLSKQTPSAPAP